MQGDFFFAECAAASSAAAAGRAPLPARLSAADNLRRRQRQAALPAADQFQIDLRREIGVQQRAMLGARRQVDAEALAQFVQRIARPGNLALGDFDRVDGAGQRNAAHGRCGPVPH